MATIGNSSEALTINHNGKIYLQLGNEYVDVLDSNGNLNVRVKNTINSITPTSGSPDGFYYDGNNVYLKKGSEIIDLSKNISAEDLLPKGSIIMYHGDQAPSGWNIYDQPTGLNNVIYIINDSEVNPSVENVTLNWKLNGSTVSRSNAIIGGTNTFPTLDINKNGDFPVQVTYSSTDESVAYVDSNNGNIILRNAGNATIRAAVQPNSYHGSANANYYLTVTKPQENIYLDWQGSVSSEGTLHITKGDNFTIPIIKIYNSSTSQEEFKTRYITYRSTNTSVATVGKNQHGDLTIQIINPGTTEIYAECEATDDHVADYARFILEVAQQKTTVTISASNQTIWNNQSLYTPTISVIGASLDEAILQISYDSSNVISNIAGRTLNLTGNPGTATINIIIPETDTHLEATKSFDLTVTEVQKETISISVSNQTITNNQNSYTPNISISGNASLSEINLYINSDSNNIINNIQSRTLNLTGNLGTATIQVSIPENSTHYSTSSTFTLTVEEEQVDENTVLYKVGLISDMHYRVTGNPYIEVDGNDSEGSPSYFRSDLQKIIDRFSQENVSFVVSPGDITTNDPNDFIEFTKDYKEYWGNNNFKNLYSTLGNHDHLIVYTDNQYCKYFRYGYNNGGGTITSDHNGERWESINRTYTKTSDIECPGSLIGNDIVRATDSNGNEINNTKSYYVIKNNNKDMYIFLSPFYGTMRNVRLNELQEDEDMSQMHPHNILSSNDVQSLENNCSGYESDTNSSNFNLQFYRTEELLWLKRTIANNYNNKRIFIISHYFFPHKAGGGNRYAPGTSAELCGITFHFLNYLNNIYPKTIWFTGHSHFSWTENFIKGLHWTNTNYNYILPTSSENSAMGSDANYSNDMYKAYSSGGSANCYNRTLGSNGTSAWNIHLPSLCKPKDANDNSIRLGCEAAIMKVYSNKVEIEKIGYTTNDGINYTEYTNSIPDNKLTIYNNGTGQCNDTGPELTESDFITFVITNPSSNNQTAYITNKFKFGSNGLTTTRPSGYDDEIPLHFGAGPWTTNTIKLEPGQSKTLTVYNPLKDYDNNGTLVSTNNINDFVGSTIDEIRTYTYCDQGLQTNLISLSINNISSGAGLQKNVTYNLSVGTIDYDEFTGYANYYTPDTPTPNNNPDHKDTPVYMDFEITNVGNYTIKTMGKVKLMVTKTINGTTYYGSIYVEPKNVNERCASIEIAPGQTYTLSHNDSAFLTKTAIQNSSNWTTVDQPLSFLNGGTCDENNTVPYDINYPDNKKQLYVYTYLEPYDASGVGKDDNGTILTELKSSNIFDAGDSNRIVTYEIDIETNEQKSYYCGS